MLLHEIALKNFRGKQDLKLELGSRLTLLMGENGSGKTTVLDAIAIALSEVLAYLPDQSHERIELRGSDIFQQGGQKFPYVLIRVKCINGPTWDLIRERDTTQLTKNKLPKQLEGLRGLHQYLDKKLTKSWDMGKTTDSPVIAYYGVSRALINVPNLPSNVPKFFFTFWKNSKEKTLNSPLNPINRFEYAFEWINKKNREESHLQRKEKNFDAKLPQLEAVRQCIYGLLPGTSNFRIETSPRFRFLITDHGQDVELTQLSDGYKTTQGLAIDLVSRMASANPHLLDPLPAESIVLIDEVDLHLHPTWQQRVISDLLRTFPKTQFILTSHSPILAESVNNVLKRHAIDHLLAKAPPEAVPEDIKNLYPLDPQCARVYSIGKDSCEDLLDPEEGLAGDPLIEGFNEVSALFNDMYDFEDEFENKDTTSTPSKEDAS